MRTQGQPTIQGYNAQAAMTAQQIVVAAEIAIESPDFGHLEPVFNAALRDLELAGVNERPEVLVADAGYWHKLQMASIVSDGTQVLIPPDSSLNEGPRAGWAGGIYDFMRRVLTSEHGYALYRQRQETIEPVFGHTKHNRGFRQFRRRGRSRPARSGVSWQQPTTSSNSTATGSSQPPAERDRRAFPRKRVPAETRPSRHRCSARVSWFVAARRPGRW